MFVKEKKKNQKKQKQKNTNNKIHLCKVSGFDPPIPTDQNRLLQSHRDPQSQGGSRRNTNHQ
jgi:hypothetical protein